MYIKMGAIMDNEYEPMAKVLKEENTIKDDEDEQIISETELPINQIILGDCVDEMKKLPDNIANLVVTDPPYGIDFESRLRADTFNKIEGDDRNNPVVSWAFAQCYRLLKENSHLYTFMRWDVLPRFLHLLKHWNFNVKNCLVGKRAAHSCGDLNYAFSPSYEMILFAHKGQREFNKTTIKLLEEGGGFVRRFNDLIDWLDVNEPSKNLMFHPTQKSLELIEFFMLLSSNEGDLIIDPFSGSGITAIAAWDLNRRFICYEVNGEYHSKSLKYLDEFKSGLHNDILNRTHKKLGYNLGKVKQVTFSTVDYRQQTKD